MDRLSTPGPGPSERGPSHDIWGWLAEKMYIYEIKYSPLRWYGQWGGLLNGRAGLYSLFRFALLLLLLEWTLFLPDISIIKTAMVIIIILGSILILFDIIIANSSVMIVSRSPRNVFRSVMLTLFSILQVPIVFSVFYSLLRYGINKENINSIHAIYFSFVTMSTLGYGDILPKEDAWHIQLLIVLEVIVNFYLVVIVIPFFVNQWQNIPSPPHQEHRQ